MKLGVKALTMALALAAPAVGGEGAKTTGVFQPGEELTYKVKWNFVRLGTIILQTVQDSSCSDRNDFKIVMIVQSNPDLPFIWIREYNESLINALSLSSRRFKARHRNGEDYYAVTQVHDGSLRTVAYTRTDLNSGALLRTDTLQNVSDYVEGPSLLFYARCIAGGRGKWSVPTIVDGAMSSTEMQVNGSIEEIDISANDDPVRTRVLTGFAHWTGGSSAGMSGEFTGWMSDDEAAIPIRAKMRILIGSITLELEKWTRPGWRPPFTQSVSTN